MVARGGRRAIGWTAADTNGPGGRGGSGGGVPPRGEEKVERWPASRGGAGMYMGGVEGGGAVGGERCGGGGGSCEKMAGGRRDAPFFFSRPRPGGGGRCGWIIHEGVAPAGRRVPRRDGRSWSARPIWHRTRCEHLHCTGRTVLTCTVQENMYGHGGPPHCAAPLWTMRGRRWCVGHTGSARREEGGAGRPGRCPSLGGSVEGRAPSRRPSCATWPPHQPLAKKKA